MLVNILIALIVIITMLYALLIIKVYRQRKKKNIVPLKEKKEEIIEEKVQYVNPVFYIVFGENKDTISDADIPVIADFVINFDDIQNNKSSNNTHENIDNAVYVEYNSLNINNLKHIEV